MIFLEQLFQHCKPVQAWHLHIQKHQVGIKSMNHLDGFDAIVALPKYLYITSGIEQVLQLFASQLFVIDDEGGDRHV